MWMQFAISVGSSTFYNIFNLLIMLTSDTIVVNGGLSSWGAWESCNVTCGGGLQRRVRSCTSPPPQLGGRQCQESSLMFQSCNTGVCPSNSVWSVLPFSGKFWALQIGNETLKITKTLITIKKGFKPNQI